MALATGAHSVLVFEKIKFNGDWTRGGGANMMVYTSNIPRCEVLVLVVDRAGTYMTHRFSNMPKGVEVWIDYNENVVHIPYSPQVRKLIGDKIK